MSVTIETSATAPLQEMGGPRSQAVDLVAELHALYSELAGHFGVQPSPSRHDYLIGELARLVTTAPSDLAELVLSDPLIRDAVPGFWGMCARRRYEHESMWANRIVKSQTPDRELTKYPSFERYRQLIETEVAALRVVVPKIRSLVFLGSGPLPLTSIFLTERLGVPVESVDREASAIATASEVADALGYPDLPLLQADAAEIDLSPYDVVVLASSVGASPMEKHEIIGHLARSMRSGAVLLARTAHGLRTLLYPAIDPSSLTGFELLDVVHPVGDVVNSAIVARVPDGND